MKKNNHSLPSLGKTLLLFPICLVLFEFATYIGNDMIQPAMLSVVKDFGVGDEWVPTSMSAYMAGGIMLQWILGPVSDRRGRRPVLFTGILFFIVTCIAILFAKSIEIFVAIRFLQGMSLCFIGAVGYAAIQESFDEAAALKITALMANVSLFAPLLGPLAGAALVVFAPWQWMFVIFAVFSLVALIGLNVSMPETATRRGEAFSFKQLLSDYKYVFSNKNFLFGAIGIGFAAIPLLTWIAQSPVVLMKGENLSTFTYGVLQIPVFGALIFGNLLLAKMSGRREVSWLIKFGGVPMMSGLVLAALGTVAFQHSYLLMVAGLSIYAFGLGIANASLYRLTLFASDMSKGTVAAAMGMISMTLFSLGIEGSKHAYNIAGLSTFNGFNLLSGLLWFAFVYAFLRTHKKVIKLEQI